MASRELRLPQYTPPPPCPPLTLQLLLGGQQAHLYMPPPSHPLLSPCSCYKVGIKHIDLHLKMMSQPPYDTKLAPYYILHYTYGMDYTLQGEFTPGGDGGGAGCPAGAGWEGKALQEALHPPPHTRLHCTRCKGGSRQVRVTWRGGVPCWHSRAQGVMPPPPLGCGGQA